MGNLSSTPDNWLMGPGVPYAQHTEAPNGDDDLIFRGDVTQAHCTLAPTVAPSAGQPHFRSLELLFSPEYGSLPGFPEPPPEPYLGTVTVAGSFAVGDLVVECGSLFQADPDTVNHPTAPHAGTLTVMLALDWTGGTLNSNTVAGVIALAPGTTSVAAPSLTKPGINERVQLGSELRLCGDEATQTGSTLTMENGTYNLIRGFFRVMAPSLLTLAPVPKKPSSPGTKSITLNNEKVTDPTVDVKSGATLKVTSVGRVNNTDPVDVEVTGGGRQVENRGTVIIDNYTRLFLGKVAESDFAIYLQTFVGEGEAAPTTKLQAGSEIVFKDNGDTTKGCMNLEYGELLLYGVPGVAQANQPEAVIKAPAQQPDGPVIAPALYVGPDAKVNFPHIDLFVTLAISGGITCVGEMNLKADGTSSKNDKITATGLMTFQTGVGAGLLVATLNVGWLFEVGGPPAADTVWKLLIAGANGGIVNDPTPAIPTVTPPDTLTAGRLADAKEYGMTFDKN